MKNLTNLFIQLARLTTVDCLNVACAALTRAGYTIDRDVGNNYAIGTPPKPSSVALVAHCDTVGREPPTKFKNRSGVVSAKGGGIIGADDRAGVAAILATIDAGHRPQVYLTTGEEIGGVGAEELTLSAYAPPDTLKVLIQIDRQGSNDFVTYDCESKPLDKWVSSFGYVKDIGSFSDISVLCPCWGIGGANVSCGYYNQHSGREMLIVPQLAHTVKRLGEMIARPPHHIIEYEEAPRFTRNVKWRDIDALDYTYRETEKEADDAWQMHRDCRCIECGDLVAWIDYDATRGMCEPCIADESIKYFPGKRGAQ